MDELKDELNKSVADILDDDYTLGIDEDLSINNECLDNSVKRNHCHVCGSSEFNVAESYIYKANLDEDNILNCKQVTGGLDIIECSVCGESYNEEDFAFVNFD